MCVQNKTCSCRDGQHTNLQVQSCMLLSSSNCPYQQAPILLPPRPLPLPSFFLFWFMLFLFVHLKVPPVWCLLLIYCVCFFVMILGKACDDTGTNTPKSLITALYIIIDSLLRWRRADPHHFHSTVIHASCASRNREILLSGSPVAFYPTDWQTNGILSHVFFLLVSEDEYMKFIVLRCSQWNYKHFINNLFSLFLHVQHQC